MKNSLQRIALTPNSQNKRFWSLPFLPPNQSFVTLYHGTKSCKFSLSKVLRTPENRVLLTSRVSKELRLSKYMEHYQVKVLNSNHLAIGPLVGILVSEKKLRNLISGKIDPTYRAYARVLSQNEGQAVFFSPKRIQWERSEVLGVIRTRTNQGEKWIEETLPLPTVIYDRCFGGNNRYQSIIIRKKCATHVPTVKIINALSKLGKREVYTLCSQIPQLKEHLPKWDILRSDNIETLLEQFPIAYIKPDRLSKGKGVTKVTKTPSGYLLEQRRDPHNYQHLCKSHKEVLEDLEPYISNQGFMLIQEAISLMKHEGRPFDFRLLLQKDLSGRWKRTGIAARISGVGSIISSPRSGGSVSSFDQVMVHLSPSERHFIAYAMINLAINCAQAIDALIGPFVELGFDLGIDSSGKVKIIEVNGIPLKVSIGRLNHQKITRAAHENPLGYAIYMAGFGGQ